MKHILFSLLILLFALPAHAELRIDITQGTLQPMPIAITSFYSDDAERQKLGRDIADVVTANLRRTGLFDPLNPQAFIQDLRSINVNGPRFPEWRAINAQALVSGTASRTADNQTRVEFRLYDVFSERQILGVAYTTNDSNWRRIAHIISDEIYKRITGEDAYFDSRIVYVSESGSTTKRVKRLAIMDQDGFNHKYLTDGSYLVLTPRFSPSQQLITYLSYYNNRPRVYLYDINTGKQEVLGNFPGMTFAPRFSPDGRKVIMSYAEDGNSDIYLMDISTKQPRRLTNNPGIDTAPSFSPDGKKVAFESDRSGSQELYVMNVDGSGVERISFGDGRYGNPVWSPRGDLIAFTKMHEGQFFIGVMRPDGSGERLITRAYHVEGPSWSPNGRVLIYFKETPSARGRSAKLYTIDLTGFNERQLQTPQDASDPAWSPLNEN
ncbi:MAG: Tol-Pal system protein TolB [Rhodospirillales bacterium]|nr:Tol-Pal system protein TolB [Rhodospirillales bacterium]